MANVLADLRLAARKLWRHPRSAAVVVLTLGLGIGATTAIASVLYKVVLEPLPYAKPDRLVAVDAIHRERGIDHGRASIGDFVDWRQQARSFIGLETSGHFSAVITGGGDPEEVPGAVVSTGFFRTLGVRPRLGRDFLAEEETPGRDQVVLLSHAFWQRRFGGDEDVVGRRINLSEDAYEIVGVLPPDFWWHGPEVALWSPMALGPDNIVRQRRGMYLIGRLRPGVSLAEAESGMRRLAAESAKLHPDTNSGWSTRVLPLSRKWTQEVRPSLLLLLAATVAVLAIACVNVLTVLLARSGELQLEAAIRAALGGSRWPLLRQQATEAMVLSLAGGICGLLLTFACIEVLVALAPRRIPRIDDVALGPPVVAFALALSLAIGLVLGCVAMLRSARADLRGSLQQSEGRSSRGRLRARLGEALIVAQVACALPLTLAVGLLAKSLAEIGEVDPGFRAPGVLVADVFLSPGRYPEDAQQSGFFERLIERLDGTPGIRSVAATSAIPMHAPALLFERPFRVVGDTAAAAESLAAIRIVSPGLFRTLGMSLEGGRDFTWQDGHGAAPVAVVNGTLARTAWPGRSPIGERLRLDYRGDRTLEVVGLVGDAHYESLESDAVAEIYLPAAQFPVFFSSLAVRAEGDPEALARLVETRVWELDPQQTVTVTTLEEVVAHTTRHRRFTIAVLAAFAAVALALTVVGIYGLMAYTVSRRTPEIGLRMALGARPAVVLGEILRWAGRLAVLGTVLGGAIAWAGSRWLERFLFGVTATDLATFIAAPALLLIVALAGSLAPALAAMRIEPTRALRYE